jgi:predicted HicB family RNase H-like nuclease
MSQSGGAQKSEHVIFVRCTKEQHERVELEAKRRGVTVAAFVRTVLLEELDFSTARADARAKPL